MLKLVLCPGFIFPLQVRVRLTWLIPQLLYTLYKMCKKGAPALFRLHSTLTTMADFPTSFPNSGPSTVHIFSLLGAITTITSSTNFGSSIQKLWVLLRYQALHNFTEEMFLSLFFRTWWIHQLKAGSCSMPLAMTYSVTWIRWDTVKLHNISHDVESAFYSQQRSQMSVDFLKFSLLLTLTLQSFTQRI